MIKRDVALKVQAQVDGQLTGREATRLTARLTRDRELSALRDELLVMKEWLREEPIERPVPESREFYWSKIQRGIAAAPTGRVRHFSSLGWWLRWLVPVGATALLCVYWFLPMVPAPDQGVHLSVGHEIETPLADTMSFSFRSESAAMTVVWVETRGLSNLALAD